MNPRVAAVITNYRTPSETLEAVESLKRTAYQDLAILVVDNDSRDGLGVQLAARHPDVRFIVNEDNLGFAGGYNTGIRAALNEGVKYVLLMNSDAIADPRMLGQLVSVCESDPGVGIISPTIFSGDGHRIWYQGGSINRILGYTRHPGRGETSLRLKNEPAETEYVSGCVMMVRREVFDAVGLLDEDYFLYYEDADFCDKARKDFRILVHPKASALHKVGSSVGAGDSRELPPLRAYYFSRNMFIFTDKHQRGPKRFAAMMAHFAVTGTYRILMVLVTRQLSSLKPALQGLWDGLIGVTGRWSDHDIWAPPRVPHS